MMFTTEYITDEIFSYFGYGAVELNEIDRTDVKNFIIKRALRVISPYANIMKEYYFKITEDNSYYTAIVRYKDRTNIYQKAVIKITSSEYNFTNFTINIEDTGTDFIITYKDNVPVHIPTLDTTTLLSVITDADTVESITITSTNIHAIQQGIFIGNAVFELPKDVIAFDVVVRALANENLDDIVYRSAWNKIIEMAYQGTGGLTNWQLSLSYLEEVRENFSEFNKGYERIKYPDLGKHGLKLYPSPEIGDWIYIRYSTMLSTPEDIPIYMQDWFLRYCIALAKDRIGRVRSKFGSLPGPAGGITLDGTQLISEAQQELTALSDELLQLDPCGQFYVM